MTERRREKFLSVLAHRQPTLTIVLEDIHDPHNASAILRSADAVGIGEIQLIYNTEAFPKMGKKSSASALKWVKRRAFRSVEECYAKLRSEGFAVYATHMGKRSQSLYELDLTGSVALVFGNEHRGVSDEAAKLADKNFLIPMTGMIRSLNVSVACAVSLYEAFRQRQASGGTERLDKAAIGKLFEEWAKK
jgi:tRNA (guanosine-2'-O-)-methyltransferase